MADGKRKGLALIIASKIPPPDKLKASKAAKRDDADEEPEEDAEDEDMGKMSAAEDLIAAVKGGDAKGVLAAIEDLYAMCGSGPAPEDE